VAYRAFGLGYWVYRAASVLSAVWKYVLLYSIVMHMTLYHIERMRLFMFPIWLRISITAVEYPASGHECKSDDRS
jgi:hypothetical protein